MQKQNTASKGKGCLVTLVIFFLMFGVPAIFVGAGITVAIYYFQG